MKKLVDVYHYRHQTGHSPVTITFLLTDRNAIIEDHFCKNPDIHEQFKYDVLMNFGKRLRVEKYLFNKNQKK